MDRPVFTLKTLFFSLLITACALESVYAMPADTRLRHGTVPQPVEAVGAAAEDIYDASMAGNWTEAKKLMDRLFKAEAKLPKDKSAVLSEDRLRKVADRLRSAIGRRDGPAAMESANEITLISAEMSRPYNPAVPVEVLLLDYYGREMQLRAQKKDLPKLSSIAKEVMDTWDRLRSKVEAQKGGWAEAERFHRLIARLEMAKTSGDYSRSAKSILDEVDNIEKVFSQ